MLIIQAKLGGGINGDGIFDFGKILLKKVLNSGLAQKASKAINSRAGKKAIKVIKRVAESDVGQELQQRAVKEVKKKVNELLPPEVKKVVNSDLGQELSSQAGESAFEKLGISRKRKRQTKPKSAKRKRGGAIVYPQHLVEQFGSGLVLE